MIARSPFGVMAPGRKKLTEGSGSPGTLFVAIADCDTGYGGWTEQREELDGLPQLRLTKVRMYSVCLGGDGPPLFWLRPASSGGEKRSSATNGGKDICGG